MKKIFLSLLVLVICGCYRNAKIVDRSGIKSIEVSITYDRSLENNLIRFSITNSDSITHIVKEMNNCAQEPLKFYPTHTLLVNYENGKTINITCNGSSLMDNNGHTFQLQRTIESILGTPTRKTSEG